MLRTPMKGSLAELIEELQSVPLIHIQDGSGSSHFDGPEGWIHGLSMNRLKPNELATRGYPVASKAVWALGESVDWAFGRPVQVMVNKVAAGKSLDPHRDGPPNRARFHLPIVTHEDVHWWDEIEGETHMDAGYWYGPVPYCGILHSMRNASPIDRIHMIVDFERGV